MYDSKGDRNEGAELNRSECANRDDAQPTPVEGRDGAHSTDLEDDLVEDSMQNRIDEAIDVGIRRGQAESRRRRLRFRRRIGGAAAACLLLLACVFSILVSPAFAAIVRDIPGFEKFVDLIRHTQDPGIGLALDNDFVQKIGISDEHDGIRLTVQGIIADDSRMVLFYETELPAKDSNVRLGAPMLTDIYGTGLPVSMSYQYPEDDVQQIGEMVIRRGVVDINLGKDEVFPDEMIWQSKLELVRKSGPNEPKMERAGREGSAETDIRDSDEVVFQVRFRIDREKFAGLQQEYPLYQTIEVEGQKITFAKAVVSPLRVSLYLDYDEANSMQIFGPGDIRLIDDQGTEWKQYLGNMVKDHPVYHFVSPYFNQPKSLHIEGSWFRALDRNKMQVKVDTAKREVLQAPDNRLSLHDVVRGAADTKLDFELRDVAEEDYMMYTLFESEFRDADGHAHKMADRGGTVTTTSSFEAGGRNQQHAYYYIDNEDYKQPLTLTIYSYPQYIRQSYSIRIK